MEKITLEKRLTHKYNAGWSHLDESEEVGTARQIGSKLKRADGESQRHLLLFLVKSAASESDIKSAFRDTLTSGCRCEHDCCGHWQVGVAAVKRIKGGNLWAVAQYSNRNI